MKTRIKLPRWLAKAENLPRIADVEIVSRTRSSVVVSGHGSVDSPVSCSICGRALTHPISQQVGIGPICAPRVGVPWEASEDPEVVEAFREKLRVATTFEDVRLPIQRILFWSDERGDFVEGSLAGALGELPPVESTGVEELRTGSVGRFELTDWIAGEKGVGTEVLARVERATEKAVLVTFVDGTGSGEAWLPKSQIVRFAPSGRQVEAEKAERAASQAARAANGSTRDVAVGSIVDVRLSSWIAGEKGLPEELRIEVRKTTAKAVLAKRDGFVGEVWLPFSQMTIVDVVADAPEVEEYDGEPVEHGGGIRGPWRPTVGSRDASGEYRIEALFGDPKQVEGPRFELPEPGAPLSIGGEELPF